MWRQLVENFGKKKAWNNRNIELTVTTESVFLPNYVSNFLYQIFYIKNGNHKWNEYIENDT